jgi:hypothetical protein
MTDATVTHCDPGPPKRGPSRNAIKQRRYRQRQKAVTESVTPRVTVTQPK